jgi:hypothetical protein
MTCVTSQTSSARNHTSLRCRDLFSARDRRTVNKETRHFWQQTKWADILLQHSESGANILNITQLPKHWGAAQISFAFLRTRDTIVTDYATRDPQSTFLALIDNKTELIFYMHKIGVSCRFIKAEFENASNCFSLPPILSESKLKWILIYRRNDL